MRKQGEKGRKQSVCFVNLNLICYHDRLAKEEWIRRKYVNKEWVNEGNSNIRSRVRFLKIYCSILSLLIEICTAGYV